MASLAQAELNDLMRDKSHRSNHPEDDNDDARSFLNLSDDDDDRTPPASTLDSDGYVPRASTSSAHPTIPRTRYGANTGPKGVISDAQNYRDSQRVHRTSLRSTSTLPQHIGQKLSRREQILEEKRGEEDDDEDDEFGLEDGDGEFMSKWREGRLKELQGGGFESKMHSRVRQRRLFGAMVTVDGDGYLEAVEGSGGDTVVVVYIYDDISQVSQAIEDCLQTLAQKHQDVRFVKLHYQDAEMEPAGVPALIAYRAGEKFAGLVPIVGEIPEDAELSALTLESVLQRFPDRVGPPVPPAESAALWGALRERENTRETAETQQQHSTYIEDRPPKVEAPGPGSHASQLLGHHAPHGGASGNAVNAKVEDGLSFTAKSTAASGTCDLFGDTAYDQHSQGTDDDLDDQLSRDAMVAAQWAALYDAETSDQRQSHLIDVLPAELRNRIVGEVVSQQPIELAVGCGPQLRFPRHLLAIAQTCRKARVHGPQIKDQVSVRLRLCQDSLINEANTCIDRAHGLEEVQRNIGPALVMADLDRLARNGLEIDIGRLPFTHLGKMFDCREERYDELRDGLDATWKCLYIIRRAVLDLVPTAWVTVSVNMAALFPAYYLRACDMGQLNPLLVPLRWDQTNVYLHFLELREQFERAYHLDKVDTPQYGALYAEVGKLYRQASKVLMRILKAHRPELSWP
ncbi:hypothetical protein LTR95_005377 [Oleoguttula sp. CCFEE 5521]